MGCCCLPMCLLKFWMFIGGVVHIIIGAVMVLVSIVAKNKLTDYSPEEVKNDIDKGYLAMLRKIKLFKY